MFRFRRPVAAVGAITALVLCGGGSAFAATPQHIYRDLADNGQLDGRYTKADIERAFDLSPANGSDALPREPMREPQASEAVPSPHATGTTDRRMPFSALDAGLLVAGSVPLLLLGAGLRRRLSAEPSKAQVVSG